MWAPLASIVGQWDIEQTGWGWKITFDIWNLLIVLGVYESANDLAPEGAVRVHLCHVIPDTPRSQRSVFKKYGRDMATNKTPHSMTVADLHHAIDLLQRDLMSLAASITYVIDGGVSQTDEIEEVIQSIAGPKQKQDIDQMFNDLFNDLFNLDP